MALLSLSRENQKNLIEICRRMEAAMESCRAGSLMKEEDLRQYQSRLLKDSAWSCRGPLVLMRAAMDRAADPAGPSFAPS